MRILFSYYLVLPLGLTFFTGFDAQGVQVLSDKLKQNEGSSVAMVLDGPSGCGKTTILHLISGLLHADSGSIIFAGQELLGLDNKSRARWRSQNIGYILQRLNLLEELSRSPRSMLSMITIGMWLLLSFALWDVQHRCSWLPAYWTASHSDIVENL